MGAKSWFAKAGRFFREVWAEIKKVAWPTRRELTVYTGVTLLSVVLVGILVWVIDIASSGAFKWLISAFTK